MSRPVNEQDERIRVYLIALAGFCLEVADRPWLLADFLRILALVPGTVRELEQAERRLAA